MRMQGYKFSISHRKGKDNVVPDALSRIYQDEEEALDVLKPVDLDSPHIENSEYRKLCEETSSPDGNYPDLKVKDKHLYIRTQHTDGTALGEQLVWKLWVPHGLTESVIKNLHDTVTSADGGMAITLELIRRSFFWPGMVAQVRDYVRHCDVSKATKALNVTLRPPMGKYATTDRPFERLYIDILGPYPRSKNGNRTPYSPGPFFSFFIYLIMVI